MTSPIFFSPDAEQTQVQTIGEDKEGMELPQLNCLEVVVKTETFWSVSRGETVRWWRHRNEDGLLLHKEDVLGETMEQIVLPSGRGRTVMEMAHTSLLNRHMRSKKT